VENILKMTDDFDREKRKSTKPTGNKQKNKDYISEDQKFASKAKKAFKNRVREIRQDEKLEDIDYYDKY